MHLRGQFKIQVNSYQSTKRQGQGRGGGGRTHTHFFFQLSRLHKACMYLDDLTNRSLKGIFD